MAEKEFNYNDNKKVPGSCATQVKAMLNEEFSEFYLFKMIDSQCIINKVYLT